MGQYHYLVNFDREEIVNPHKIGLGLKQREHAHTVASLPDVLYMLVTTSPNRGGGDLSYDEALESKFITYGRWVGDRVAVFGDYTENKDVPFLKAPEKDRPASVLEDGVYRDITDQIIPAFEKAFGVEISVRGFSGYRERKLTRAWNWLFPNAEKK